VFLDKKPTGWYSSHSPSPQQEVHVQTTTPQTTHQEDRPSFSIRLYELGDRFGTYRSRGPSAETFRGATLAF
jgi:hypothetical protein